MQITESLVRRAQESSQGRAVLTDDDLKGFRVIIFPSRRVSFYLRYRVPGSAQNVPPRDLKIADWPTISVAQARKLAVRARAEIALGRDPAAERNEARTRAQETVREVAAMFIERHVRPNTRRPHETVRFLDRFVISRFGSRPIRDVRRSEIAAMLDNIADTSGLFMADRTLRITRKMMNWFAARTDDFVPPIARGMARTSGMMRTRVLTDHEIRALWKATETLDTQSRAVRLLLLSGLRRNEATHLHAREVDWTKSVLTIPASRMKGKLDHTLPLTPTMRALIGEPDGYVFATSRGKPIGNFDRLKKALGAQMGSTDWRFHDLRRTAVTLMRRQSVPRDTVEAVVAHKPPLLIRTYDRHDPIAEKLKALEALEAAVRVISQ
jgi:integrase